MRFWGKRVHVSWVVASLCLGFCLGVVWVGVYETALAIPVGILSVCTVVIVLAMIRSRVATLLIVCLMGAALGIGRASPVLTAQLQYENVIDQTVWLSGRVAEDADVNAQGQSVLRLKDIVINNQQYAGKIWVTTAKNDHIKRSDTVVLEGRLNEGFATFSAAMYRGELKETIREAGVDPLLQVRDTFSRSVQQYIDEPAVSLGLGYLTGQRRGLPPELLESLQIAGLTHIIVASGYNLTILVRLSRRMLAGVSKYLATAVSLGLVLGFIGVTGMSPSMSRAGLVTGLSLLAWYYGRKFHPVALLLFVAAATMIVDPTYGWGDLGWMLSFAAFIGVLIVAPLGQAYFYGDKKPPFLLQIFGETLAAFIMTAPLLMVSFGVVSNVALLANSMILPFIPFAMLGVFLVGIFGFFWSGLAEVCAALVSWLLEYMLFVATFWAERSWAQTEYSVPVGAVVVMYGVIAAACVYMRYTTHYRLRTGNIVE